MEYFLRQLREGWKCISIDYPIATILSPCGCVKDIIDLRNDTETFLPNGVGDNTEIQDYIGSAIHWQNVDEASPNTSDYNCENRFSWYLDLYALPASSGSGTITNVAVRCYMKGYSGGGPVAGGRTAIKTGGTVYYGTAFTHTSAWVFRTTNYALNPKTSAAWTWAEIDALQAGASLRWSDDEEAQPTSVSHVLITVTFTAAPPPGPPVYWSRIGFRKRIKLTIDSGDIDAPLADFPVLVHLSTSSGISNFDVSCVFDELGSDANRKKIAVTLSDGLTQCYVEIEKWDDANEVAWLWVKVPSVADGANTVLYLYYDNSHADNDAYVGDTNSTPAENVWDGNFLFVCHMRDDPDTSHIRDSTGNNRDGTKRAANQPAVTTSGQIGDAQDFDGADDYVTLGDILDFDLDDPCTLEAWVKRKDTTHGGFMVCKQLGAPSYQGYYMYVNESNWKFGYVLRSNHATGNMLQVDTTANYQTNVSWIKFGITYTGSETAAGVLTYVAGASVAHGHTVDNLTATTINTAPFCVGIRNLSAGPWGGILEEVRVSDIVRTPAWMAACNDSETDDLITFSDEEEELPRHGFANYQVPAIM